MRATTSIRATVLSTDKRLREFADDEFFITLVTSEPLSLQPGDGLTIKKFRDGKLTIEPRQVRIELKGVTQ